VLALLLLAALLTAVLRDPGGGERADGAPNLWIGTGGSGYAYGATSPAACVPYGLARPGPDTTSGLFPLPWHHFSGYHFADDRIRGFSQTRISGIGVPDYGNLSLLPARAASGVAESEDEPRVAFSHEDEVARPGSYTVTLRPWGIRVELSATTLCALHRYSFAEKGRGRIRLDAGAAVPGARAESRALSLDAGRGEVSGVIRILGSLTGRSGGADLAYLVRVRAPVLAHGAIGPGERRGVWLEVEADPARPLEVAVGLSYVDVETARANLDAEVGARPFDEVRAAAEARWAAQIGRIEVEGGTAAERTIFASALYHAFVQPTDVTEAGGRHRGLDGKVHALARGRRLTDLSLWDTCRTQVPLMALVDPERAGDLARSLTSMGREGGRLPRWPTAYGYTGCMSGDSAPIALADLWLRGIRDFDLAAAYETARAGALEPPPPGSRADAREGLADALRLGYVPCDRHGGAASETIEQAQADHAIATLAAALGREEDRALFARRALSWRALYDPASGWIAGRRADGTLAPPRFDWLWDDAYTEGNARQWLWAPALFDLEGLASLAGGGEALLARLERFFEADERRRDTPLPDVDYWHGNEPDIHAPFLFALLGRPDLTQRWARRVLETRYGTGAGGLDGNDDCGTLSAWYVCAALGIYPWAGSSRWVLSAPLFREARIRREAGDIVIRALGDPARERYVRAVTLDGRPLERPWLEHGEIARGAEVVFTLSATPTGWGRGSAEAR
jgi:putative alpha-1,2-mannosidase